MKNLIEQVIDWKMVALIFAAAFVGVVWGFVAVIGKQNKAEERTRKAAEKFVKPKTEIYHDSPIYDEEFQKEHGFEIPNQCPGCGHKPGVEVGIDGDGKCRFCGAQIIDFSPEKNGDGNQ